MDNISDKNISDNKITMDKEYLIQLTKTLYSVTLLFPKKEPLRYKMRETADEILANFFQEKRAETQPQQVLNGYFEIAIAQNWVTKDLLLEIQDKYAKIGEQEIPDEQGNFFKEESKEEEKQAIIRTNTITERQKKILDILKENGSAQVCDIQKFFPKLTKRTVRRDFEAMLKQGLVERIGERNATFYTIKS